MGRAQIDVVPEKEATADSYVKLFSLTFSDGEINALNWGHAFRLLQRALAIQTIFTITWDPQS